MVSIVTLDSQIVLVNKRKAMAGLSCVPKADNTGGQGSALRRVRWKRKDKGRWSFHRPRLS